MLAQVKIEFVYMNHVPTPKLFEIRTLLNHRSGSLSAASEKITIPRKREIENKRCLNFRFAEVNYV